MTSTLYCRILGSQMARVSSEAPSGKVGPDTDEDKTTRQLLDQYRLIPWAI